MYNFVVRIAIPLKQEDLIATPERGCFQSSRQRKKEVECVNTFFFIRARIDGYPNHLLLHPGRALTTIRARANGALPTGGK